MSGKRIAAAGVVVALLAGATIVMFAQQVTPAQRASAAAAVTNAAKDGARFQIVFSPYARADTFLLDTETGRIWQPTQWNALVGDPTIWQIQERVDTDAQLTAWLRLQDQKPKPN